MKVEKTDTKPRPPRVSGKSSTVEPSPVNRRKSRVRAARKGAIIVAMLAIVAGVQMYFYYSGLEPRFARASGQFVNLVDERRGWVLTQEVTSSINGLKELSEDEQWQKEVEALQNEFQSFISSPAEGMDGPLNRLSRMGGASPGDGGFTKLERILVRIEEWHHDHYGDIAAHVARPPLYYWPASILIKRINAGTITDEVQFNRALYHILVGEVSAGQAALGELRTRLPDSPLRARVLYTQGRLLYGMGRYEQSIEVVQDSLRIDPSSGLAKRFLEYQLSRGPDEEVEEEDEGFLPFGSASMGGGTLF